jgi:hypothetical protein
LLGRADWVEGTGFIGDLEVLELRGVSDFEWIWAIGKREQVNQSYSQSIKNKYI